MLEKSILVVGHGSRIPQANRDFETFVGRFQSYLPDRRINWGYIELAEPSLKEALRQAAGPSEEVTVLPLFLFAGGHVKKDIPLEVSRARKEFPQVSFQAARALGVDPRMVQLALKRLREASSRLKGEKGKTVTVVLGRGASDPDANGDFYKLVRLIEVTSGFQRAIPCHIGICPPYLKETLERVALERPESILILPYLLFPGRLIQDTEETAREFRERYPWISVEVAAPLGEDPLIFELLKERVEVPSLERPA